MKLHEYQAKAILADEGVAVPGSLLNQSQNLLRLPSWGRFLGCKSHGTRWWSRKRTL